MPSLKHPADWTQSKPPSGAGVGSGPPNRSQDERMLSLRQDLARARDELASLQALMETLPEIFERKFQERMAPLLQQRERLLEQNTGLRQNLLPPQVTGRAIQGNPVERPRLGTALRHAFGLSDQRAS